MAAASSCGRDPSRPDRPVGFLMGLRGRGGRRGKVTRSMTSGNFQKRDAAAGPVREGERREPGLGQRRGRTETPPASCPACRTAPRHLPPRPATLG